MNGIQVKAIEAIEAQQAKVKEYSPQWMVGEQLKGICRAEPGSAGLVAQDLAVAAMSITEAEKKIKAFADGRRVGNSSCVTLIDAERILREFYGLPAAGAQPSGPAPADGPDGKINPLDFL